MISVILRLTGQSYAPNGASGRYGLLTSHPSRVWPADSRSFAGLHVRLAEYWRKMEESNPYRYQHHRVQTGSPTSERHLPIWLRTLAYELQRVVRHAFTQEP